MYAIEVRDLSKVYRLYRRPFDRLKEAVLRRPLHQPFESLKDVSFFVPFGSCMGVLGENGAGKSTLLKMLAGTLTPTSGEVVKRGRTAAILELGAGFHSEFTGRQNIYLRAALLGLTDLEIREKENDIIDFAELGGFIDRPLKTYSSGMVMRLAFSVATSLDPDILIVDEALSVGDQPFQEKCVARMKGFRERGKTILFCSHSMFLVNELCEEAIWLAHGRVRGRGRTSKVINEYLGYLEERSDNGTRAEVVGVGAAPPEIRILDVQIVSEAGQALERVQLYETVVFRIRTRRSGAPFAGHLALSLVRPDGQLVFGTTTQRSGLGPLVFDGEQVTELVLPRIPFQGGRFKAVVLVGDRHSLHLIDQRSSPSFLVESEQPEMGLLFLDHEWRVTSDSHSPAARPSAGGRCPAL